MTTNNTNEYVNYGDVNPLEHGGEWLMKDQDTKTTYNIVKLTNLEHATGTPGFLIDIAYIDITEWNHDNILSFIGGDEDTSPEEIAMGILAYYGPEECNGYSIIYDTEEEAIEELAGHEITIDIEEE